MEKTSNRFRHSHILAICSEYCPSKGPLSLFLQRYFASHRACGSQDRRAIRETLFSIWRFLPALLTTAQEELPPWKVPCLQRREKIWSRLFEIFQSAPDHNSLDLSYCALPEPLYSRLLGEFTQLLSIHDSFDSHDSHNSLEEAKKRVRKLVLPQLSPPQIDLRTNPLKGSRDQLVSALPASWKAEVLEETFEGIAISPSEKERSQVALHPLYKEGYFEIQDRGSQQTLQLLPPLCSNVRILDYCAGSGGKSLALLGSLKQAVGKELGKELGKTKNNAVLWDFSSHLSLFDIRQEALLEAEKRLERCGAKADILFTSPSCADYSHIIIDAPCSGSGTWRRQSELKWIFDDTRLDQRIEQNRVLFESICSAIKPQADLLYITCSIFPSENELFIESQVQRGTVELINEKRIDPSEFNDGFYVAHCKKLG